MNLIKSVDNGIIQFNVDGKKFEPYSATSDGPIRQANGPTQFARIYFDDGSLHQFRIAYNGTRHNDLPVVLNADGKRYVFIDTENDELVAQYDNSQVEIKEEFDSNDMISERFCGTNIKEMRFFQSTKHDKDVIEIKNKNGTVLLGYNHGFLMAIDDIKGYGKVDTYKVTGRKLVEEEKSHRIHQIGEGIYTCVLSEADVKRVENAIKKNILPISDLVDQNGSFTHQEVLEVCKELKNLDEKQILFACNDLFKEGFLTSHQYKPEKNGKDYSSLFEVRDMRSLFHDLTEE